ncbi:MAG: accessory factor UbiK family protein [Enterobacterales bacterium]|nr:accessory factor UbiK family protein [Enterobacterales bacterium]
MLDSSKIEELADKFSQSIPAGAKNFQQDIEKNFKQVLQSLVTKMDLVTREEFDVQTKVLQRTREKIDQLEKQMAQMEQDATQ